MNITLLNKNIIFLILIAFTLNINAQETKPNNKGFALSFNIGNGLIANIDAKNNLTDNIFYSPSIRVLWEPNHLLNIGIESSYLTMLKQDSSTVSTTFSSTIFRARLNAIPILLVFNMKVAKIDLYYGIGLSYVTSKLEAFNDRVEVSNWYYCYDLAIAYKYPLSKSIDIGIEAKSYFFPKVLKISGGAVINFTYTFLKW